MTVSAMTIHHIHDNPRYRQMHPFAERKLSALNSDWIAFRWHERNGRKYAAELLFRRIQSSTHAYEETVRRFGRTAPSVEHKTRSVSPWPKYSPVGIDEYPINQT